MSRASLSKTRRLKGQGPDSRTPAGLASLRYVNDDEAGLRRRRAGKGFAYFDEQGRRVTDKVELWRIERLAIPPAWTQVWICADAAGHIQATGRDARGRKQYRYHPRWVEQRNAAKYQHIVGFCRALPLIRHQADLDMRRPGLPREKVLAALVRLLDSTLIRIGNDAYATENKSYGLTTLRNRHVEIEGHEIRFEFTGKSGKVWNLALRDRRIARVVKACQDLPGQRLFQYLEVDEQGRQQRRAVSSSDVNQYLREVTGQDITAKDFRTWAGTVLAAYALHEFEHFDSQTAAKRNLTRAIRRVATRLGNTPAICRKCYVHPEIMSAYLHGSLIDRVQAGAERVLRQDLQGLSAEEAAVLAFLQQRPAREKRRSAA